MLPNHFIENIPNFRTFLFHHFLCAFDRCNKSTFFEFVINKGLEQLEGHFFRQSALMQPEFGTNDDDRTARVVDSFSQQVLTEATGFSFEHVAQRLQRATVLPSDRAAPSAVVEQSVNGFLEHALLVTNNHIRRAEFHEPFQAVVPVDDSAIKIVEVGSRKPSAIKGHERAEIWRYDRNNL